MLVLCFTNFNADFNYDIALNSFLFSTNTFQYVVCHFNLFFKIQVFFDFTEEKEQ